MSVENDPEAALRQLLQPKANAPKQRLITQTVIFWKDDWQAFLRGMIEATGIEPIYVRRKGTLDTLQCADYRKIIEMEFEAFRGMHNVFFNHQADYDAIYEGRSHVEAGARLQNIYLIPGKTGRYLGSLHALTLKSTTIHGVRYDSDAEKKAFLRLMKRVARKCSTNDVPVYKNDTGEFYSSDFKGHPVRFGYGALRWQRAEPNRLLDYGARAPEDWQFPEDHPWYQDES